MTTIDTAPIERFRYLGFDVERGVVRCRYGLDDRWTFEERIALDPGGDWDGAAAAEASRLVYLLAGVSYYKTAAPMVVDLGDTPLRPAEAAFLRSYYVDGLGEFAHVNRLDLDGLVVVGGTPVDGPGAPYAGDPERALLPFGGGIDSIVTVEAIRAAGRDTALFVVSREGSRFAAIEDAAAVTGLPVVRAVRRLDPSLLEGGHGFRQGHVPITAIISALAVLASVLEGRGTVVMANEWSASIGSVVADGRTVNHQHSKSWDFERDLRAVLAAAFDAPPEWFSFLRDRSELWVAQRFAALEAYHPVFRSCNRAFHQDPARRLDHWCGVCDKCCFIDLVLAPFLPREALQAVFAGREPLSDPALLPQLRALLGLSADVKPFECVGDVGECRSAAVLAADRPDRAGEPVLAALVAELGPEAAERARAGAPDLLRPLGPSHVPDLYAVHDRLD